MASLLFSSRSAARALAQREPAPRLPARRLQYANWRSNLPSASDVFIIKETVASQHSKNGRTTTQTIVHLSPTTAADEDGTHIPSARDVGS